MLPERALRVLHRRIKAAGHGLVPARHGLPKRHRNWLWIGGGDTSRLGTLRNPATRVG
jgi:hypothetical protein